MTVTDNLNGRIFVSRLTEPRRSAPSSIGRESAAG